MAMVNLILALIGSYAFNIPAKVFQIVFDDLGDLGAARVFVHEGSLKSCLRVCYSNVYHLILPFLRSLGLSKKAINNLDVEARERLRSLGRFRFSEVRFSAIRIAEN